MHTHIIALATFLTLTMPFVSPHIPPQGTVYVLEVGPATYACTVLATKCVFTVDAAAYRNEIANQRGVCYYERSHPDSRTCQWSIDMQVQRPSKRRIGPIKGPRR